MVRQWQKLYYNSRMSGSDKSLRKKDFIKAAEADGFKFAVRLDKKADMERVIREWLSFPGPAFLEVIIDRDAGVYPMVGPGLTYDQMITGDFIPTRSKVSEEEIDSSEMFYVGASLGATCKRPLHATSRPPSRGTPSMMHRYLYQGCLQVDGASHLVRCGK